MNSQKYGVKIGFTGITREEAAEALAEQYGWEVFRLEGEAGIHGAREPGGRAWHFVKSPGITGQKDENGVKVIAPAEYRNELVTPLCEYDDLDLIEDVANTLVEKGAITNKSCRMQVHVDASKFERRSLDNLSYSLISREKLLYDALQLNVKNKYTFAAKDPDTASIEALLKRPKSEQETAERWKAALEEPAGPDDRDARVSFEDVERSGTVGYRLFPADLTKGGWLRTGVQLSLAMSDQAITQKSIRIKPVDMTNPKYTMRGFLLRMGLNGKEFKGLRAQMTEKLSGDVAWRDPQQGIDQRERMKSEKQSQRTSDQEIDEMLDNEDMAYTGISPALEQSEADRQALDVTAEPYREESGLQAAEAALGHGELDSTEPAEEMEDIDVGPVMGMGGM